MTDMETATRITGPCSCHEVYTSRGLIAPDCAFHDMAREIAEALEETRHEALEKAAKVADDVQESEREEKRLDKEGGDYDPYSYGAGFSDGSITTSVNIGTAIRALSPPVKDTP